MADEDLIAWEMLYGGGGKPSEDWQPPSDWLEVPEPGEYDIYALVNAFESNAGISMILTDTNFSGGNGAIVCDWGDGTKETVTGQSRITHVYADSGQFLIHIVCDDKTNFISSLSESPYGAYYLIVKTGRNIFWAVKAEVTYTGTTMLNSLKSLTILNDNSISDINNQGLDSVVSFRNMRTLQKLQCPKVYVANLNASGGFLGGTSTRNMKNILKNFDLSKCTSVKKEGQYDSGKGLYNNVNLKELELPNCEYIGAGMFEYCMNLEKIIAPKCTYVGDYAFRYCFNLQEVQFSEDCVFDGYNCFYDCRSLYPRPDGPTN